MRRYADDGRGAAPPTLVRVTIRAVPLLAVSIAALLGASAVGAVVVSGEDDDEVTTGPSTSTSFPPFEDSTTSSSVPETIPTQSEVVAPPASVAPVTAPGATTTSSTAAAAAPPAPTLAVDPAACQPPPAQPAAGAPAGPVGVFTTAVANGSVKLVGASARLGAWRPRTGQVVSVGVGQGKPSALCLSAPDGSGAKRLTTPVGVGRPAVSFDGARLAVRSARPNGVDLVVFSVEGADQKLLLQSTEMNDPVWLGDGSAVVVCTRTGGATRLVAVPAGGGEPKVLRDVCPPGPVASSPDGKRIAFALADQVVVLEVASRSITFLKIGAISTASAPSWSANGRRLAFAYSDPQGPALGIMDLDAKNGSTLLRQLGLAGPSWAPAGDLIAFPGTDAGGPALFVVRQDGTGLRKVAGCQTRCSIAPQPWAPDASQLVLELSGAA